MSGVSCVCVSVCIIIAMNCMSDIGLKLSKGCVCVCVYAGISYIILFYVDIRAERPAFISSSL